MTVDGADLGPARSPVRRPAAWTTFGVLLPLVAFGFDLGIRVDPVLWGLGARGFGDGGGDGGVGGRALLVYALLGLSMVGLVLAMQVRTRAGRALALPLLTLGTLLAGLHALVFVPLIPLSAMAIMLMGLGLLGFTPFFALWAYASALGAVAAEQLAAAEGRPWRWVVAPMAAGLLPVALALGAYDRANGAVERMRGGGPAAISRGFRELGPLAHLVEAELMAVYVELDGPAQLRMRNLYLERFERDPTGRIGRWRR